MSAKGNGNINLDREAMKSVADAVNTFLSSFDENLKKFEQGVKELSDENLFEASGEGANLVATLNDAMAEAQKTFEVNSEKLGAFVKTLETMAEKLGEAIVVNNSAMSSITATMSQQKAKAAEAHA